MATHRTLRGVGEIKTRSGNNSAEALPHKLHMRLCALEMERYRRDQERQVALARAEQAQARCEEIESEVRSLQAAILKRVPTHGIRPDIHVESPVRVGRVKGEARSSSVTHLY